MQKIIYRKDRKSYYDGFLELENKKLIPINKIDIIQFIKESKQRDIETKIKTTAGNYTTYLSALK